MFVEGGSHVPDGRCGCAGENGGHGGPISICSFQGGSFGEVEEDEVGISAVEGWSSRFATNGMPLLADQRAWLPKPAPSPMMTAARKASCAAEGARAW